MLSSGFPAKCLHSLITSDSEYSLFSVVIFKKVHDEFLQKCRENKLVYSRDLIRYLTSSASDSFSETSRSQRRSYSGNDKNSKWPTLLRKNYGYNRSTQPLQFVTDYNSLLDRAPATVSDQLFRVIPGPRSPQGRPALRRKCSQIRPSC